MEGWSEEEAQLLSKGPGKLLKEGLDICNLMTMMEGSSLTAYHFT